MYGYLPPKCWLMQHISVGAKFCMDIFLLNADWCNIYQLVRRCMDIFLISEVLCLNLSQYIGMKMYGSLLSYQKFYASTYLSILAWRCRGHFYASTYLSILAWRCMPSWVTRAAWWDGWMDDTSGETEVDKKLTLGCITMRYFFHSFNDRGTFPLKITITMCFHFITQGNLPLNVWHSSFPTTLGQKWAKNQPTLEDWNSLGVGSL